MAANPSSARHALLLARVCLVQSDTAGAQVALSRAIELQPDSAIAHFLLARIHVAAKEPLKAIANLETALARTPANLPALLLLAVLQHERGEYPAARANYEKALAIDPKNTLGLNNLAYLYAERFDLVDQALELAQRARVLLPQDPRTADTVGWVLVKKKQYLAARALLQDSAQQLPDEPEVHFHLGTACYFLGDEPAARTAFERALALSGTFPNSAVARERLAVLGLDPTDPASRTALEKQLLQASDDPVARVRLATAAVRDGDDARALAHFQAMLKANAKHPAALLGVAQLYARKSDLPRALESAKAARAVAPGNPAVTHVLGRLAFDSGDYRWAESLLEEAGRAQPDNAEILYDRAQAAYSLGRVDEAVDEMRAALAQRPAFSRAIEATGFLQLIALAATPPPATGAEMARVGQLAKAMPANVPALMVVAAVAERDRDGPEAKRTYERVLQRYPDFAPAQRKLILLYVAGTTDSAKAPALAAKARQSFPNDPEVAQAAGVIAYRAGDFTKAAALLQEAAAKKPGDGELMFYLGMAQYRLNRRSVSKVSLQQALVLGVTPPMAVEAKQSLAALE
jgi:tetratricopeptide (TPR) repeat protein